jgi:hypothetical protein
MFGVQIPSTKLLDFLGSREGGRSLGECQEYIQPTLDIERYLYDASFANFVHGAANTTVITKIGPRGLYLMQLSIAGYVRNGVNAGEVIIEVFPTGQSGDFTGSIVLLRNYMGATTVNNFQTTIFQFLIPLGASETISVHTGVPAAITGLGFEYTAYVRYWNTIPSIQ